MTASWDEPQPDTRLPGFGCGPSFGMLGPSRILLRPGQLPAPWDRYNTGVVLPYRTTGGVSPPWFAQWQAVFPDAKFDVFLSLLNYRTGLWRLNGEVSTTPFGGGNSATRHFTNFEWQFPPLHVDEQIGIHGSMVVYRIGEWQTVTKRWPSANIPEKV